jgi:hypothetical protein
LSYVSHVNSFSRVLYIAIASLLYDEMTRSATSDHLQCSNVVVGVHVGAGFKPALAQQTRTTRLQIRGMRRTNLNAVCLHRAVVTGGFARGYYEHVIRGEIANNPARWADDPENISRAV